MEPKEFQEKMKQRWLHVDAEMIEKMREYIAYRCCGILVDTLKRTYLRVGFTEDPSLVPYDPGDPFGTHDPQVIVVDPQIEPLDDNDFAEFKLDIARQWSVDTVGLKIGRVDGDTYEAHFLIAKSVGGVVDSYKELRVH